jgi:hypothetical protein
LLLDRRVRDGAAGDKEPAAADPGKWFSDVRKGDLGCQAS